MYKAPALALLFAFAAASQATVINIISEGTFTLNGTGYTTDERVIFQNTPSAVTNLTFTGTYSGVGAVGTLFYTGAGGDLTLTFTAPGPFQVAGNTSSLNGTWTYTSGTGAYAGYTGGTGTFAAVYNTAGTYSSTTLTGDLTPVPEPATLAVLGIGALAAARRRRR